MCLGLPGRVINLPADRPDVARVDVGGVVRTVHLGMLGTGPLVPGDWLEIHLGFAIDRMTEADALQAMAYEENDPFGAMLADLTDPEAVPPSNWDPSSSPSRT